MTAFFEPGACVRSDSLGEKATIDTQVDAGDEGGGLGAGEKDRCAGEFIGIAEAVQGGVRENGLGARSGGAVFLEQEGAVLFSGEETGSEGVDTDSKWSPFACQKAGEIDHGSFGRRIGDDPGQWQVGGNAGDIDNAAAAAFDHACSKNLTGEQSSADQVAIEGFFPVFDADLREGILGSDG